jgi:hypothetical protein
MHTKDHWEKEDQLMSLTTVYGTYSFAFVSKIVFASENLLLKKHCIPLSISPSNLSSVFFYPSFFFSKTYHNLLVNEDLMYLPLRYSDQYRL